MTHRVDLPGPRHCTNGWNRPVLGDKSQDSERGHKAIVSINWDLHTHTYYPLGRSLAGWMVFNLPLRENKLNMMAGQHRWAAAKCLEGASDEPLLWME